MQLSKIFHLNEKGRRERSEDNIFPEPRLADTNDRLFIVCDGVGGVLGGDIASRMACDQIADYILSHVKDDITEYDITSALFFARGKLQAFGRENLRMKSMSTTVSLVYLNRNSIWAAWCGDSRIYHIRNGHILWKSKDHSVIQELLDHGKITEEEALTHPDANVLFSYLSAEERTSELSVQNLTNIRPRDYVLLCTDGILENVDDPVLMKILGEDQPEEDKARLFLKQCSDWTFDNYSMYLLQLDRN